MHYLNTPKVLQFEISSNCNANCIGCSRADPYDELPLNPRIIKNKFLDLEIFKKIINATSLGSVEEIQFCGSIDDPPMHPQFLEMLEYIVLNTTKSIVIHTNGSLRTPSYWAKMASILEQRNGKYTLNFSIDGLADTNHIYRRGTNFSKIIENATAFIQAGGSANWQWVVFPWNASQIEEAKELSRSIGFKRFKERPDTCLDNRELDKLYERTALEKKRAEWDWDRYLKSFNDEKYHSGEIYCKTGNDDKLYFVAHTGEIFPCCFLYNIRYQVVDYKKHTEKYTNAYGENWNNANYNDVNDIISGPFFSNDLTDSWNNKNHSGCSPSDRNPICTNTCSRSRRQRWENTHTVTDLVSNTTTVDKNRWDS